VGLPTTLPQRRDGELREFGDFAAVEELLLVSGRQRAVAFHPAVKDGSRVETLYRSSACPFIHLAGVAHFLPMPKVATLDLRTILRFSVKGLVKRDRGVLDLWASDR
jgi:hypothetical protein